MHKMLRTHFNKVTVAKSREAFEDSLFNGTNNQLNKNIVENLSKVMDFYVWADAQIKAGKSDNFETLLFEHEHLDEENTKLTICKNMRKNIEKNAEPSTIDTAYWTIRDFFRHAHLSKHPQAADMYKELLLLTIEHQRIESAAALLVTYKAYRTPDIYNVVYKTMLSVISDQYTWQKQWEIFDNFGKILVDAPFPLRSAIELRGYLINRGFDKTAVNPVDELKKQLKIVNIDDLTSSMSLPTPYEKTLIALLIATEDEVIRTACVDLLETTTARKHYKWLDHLYFQHSLLQEMIKAKNTSGAMWVTKQKNQQNYHALLVSAISTGDIHSLRVLIEKQDKKNLRLINLMLKALAEKQDNVILYLTDLFTENADNSAFTFQMETLFHRLFLYHLQEKHLDKVKALCEKFDKYAQASAYQAFRDSVTGDEQGKYLEGAYYLWEKYAAFIKSDYLLGRLIALLIKNNSDKLSYVLDQIHPLNHSLTEIYDSISTNDEELLPVFHGHVLSKQLLTQETARDILFEAYKNKPSYFSKELEVLGFLSIVTDNGKDQNTIDDLFYLAVNTEKLDLIVHQFKRATCDTLPSTKAINKVLTDAVASTHPIDYFACIIAFAALIPQDDAINLQLIALFKLAALNNKIKFLKAFIGRMPAEVVKELFNIAIEKDDAIIIEALYQPEYVNEALMAAVRAQKKHIISYLCSKADKATLSQAFLLAIQQYDIDTFYLSIMDDFFAISDDRKLDQAIILQAFDIALNAKQFRTMGPLCRKLDYHLPDIATRVLKAISNKNIALVKKYHAINPLTPYTEANLSTFFDRALLDNDTEDALFFADRLSLEAQGLAYFNLLQSVKGNLHDTETIVLHLSKPQLLQVAEVALNNHCPELLRRLNTNPRVTYSDIMTMLAEKETLVTHFPLFANLCDIDDIFSLLHTSTTTYPDRKIVRIALAALFDNYEYTKWSRIQTTCTNLLAEQIQPDIKLLLKKAHSLTEIRHKLITFIQKSDITLAWEHAQKFENVHQILCDELFKENPDLAAINVAFNTACDNAYKDLGRNLSTRIILNGLIALFIPLFGALAIALITYYNRGKNDKVGFFATTSEEDHVIDLQRTWARPALGG